MREVVGQRFIFAVAQQPFEAASAESGVYHKFCALLPLFDPNGESANPHDFPDNGDVWWMIRPAARALAEPGRLVTAYVEDSIKKGVSGLAQYQVVADSVEPLRARDFVEIIDVPVSAIKTPRDLISTWFRLELDHAPLSSVYIQWGHSLLGRFTCTSEPSEEPGIWSVRFRPESVDRSVITISKDILDVIARSHHLIANVDVSLEARPLHESVNLNHCHYHLLDTDALNAVIPSDVERVSLRTDDEIVKSLAKRLMSRKERQTLVSMLGRLESLVDQSSESMEREEHEILNTLKAGLVRDTETTARLAEAIVKGGFVEEKIKEAINEQVEAYIGAHAAKLQSEINKKVAVSRHELESLRDEKTSIESEMERYRSSCIAELEKTLEEKRKASEADIQWQERDAQSRFEQLQQQERVLSENLEQIASTLTERQSEVVNQLLTIVPILGGLGLFPRKADTIVETQESGRPSRESESTCERQDDEPVFEIPRFVSGSGSDSVTESEFFERFKRHVENSGFRYREIDLLRFHVSVKTGDLTILGGLPGTGKSSLVRLYAEAIGGDARGVATGERFLHIAVSPSWLDMRDLLGHVNALNHTFQPADSSLFQHLVLAQEEYREMGEATGLYFASLDEMNLSQVEHYFGGILQVLENPVGHRSLRCFAENVVAPQSSFSRWSKIEIPMSIRFIGTVNFDETTKQLSQRLLDRANLIRLPSDQLPLELEPSAERVAEGSPVTLLQYRSWIRNTASFSDELAELVDSLREDLRMLNCPMNPRRFSAMRKFVASWPVELASTESAVDLQLAQRVLPQIRGLFQPGARGAVKSIRRKLEQHPLGFPESLRVLEEIHRFEHGDLPLDSGDLP